MLELHSLFMDEPRRCKLSYCVQRAKNFSFLEIILPYAKVCDMTVYLEYDFRALLLSC